MNPAGVGGAGAAELARDRVAAGVAARGTARATGERGRARLGAAIGLLLLAAAIDRSSARLPDFDQLWDYDHPAESERRFRELLPGFQAEGDLSLELQLRTQIARALGLERRYGDAQRLLDEVRADLSAHGQDPDLPAGPAPALRVARIRYLLERGRLLHLAGQPGRAQPLFLRAWNEARTAGCDFQAIDAAHMLAIVEPVDARLDWDRRALALAEASRDARSKHWLPTLHANIGVIWLDRGDAQQALASFETALALWEEQGSAKPIPKAKQQVAQALRQLRCQPEARAVRRDLEAEPDREGSPPDGFVEEEIGACLLARGEPERAHPYFVKAYALLLHEPRAERRPGQLERLRRLAGAAG